MSTSYDQIPYPSLPFPQTHPDRLATLAALFGMKPPPVAGCRVLEIGCASGGNLIPLAEQIPGVECVGVDLSDRQIAEGKRIVDSLGYQSIRLVAGSVEDIDASLGAFDYILCHGVYSWVPGSVQEAILRVCRERMQPEGITYISYNTLPGWRMRSMIRDLMRHHALAFPSPQQQVAQARAILDFLARAVPAENSAYGTLLQQELAGLSEVPDAYIFHEHLEEVNEPVYFREFVERATRNGLKFLAEADFASMLASRFPPEVAETVCRIAPDIIGREQLMDFVCNRTFRQSLLIHSHRPVDRTVTNQRIDGLWLACPLQIPATEPDLAGRSAESFLLGGGACLTASHPLTKATLHELAAHWPRPLPFGELVRKAQARLGSTGDADTAAVELLRADLMRAYSAGLLTLHSSAPPVQSRPDARPKASPLALLQAAEGRPVTSLLHQQVRLDDAARTLLSWLDGATSRERLAARFQEHFSAADPAAFDGMLAEMARVGLLTANRPVKQSLSPG
ncbi:class I SAM-dependent methyltransferase [Methyloterricola oryzae]|uniref:class I SAM-dependent methyltransferase n=1 Tax=Methyloterricola oryzae TaxID=1495050 RepID=UPI00069B0587|nr:class I SAM-dependent methyltransferase [Methyloterricola oryzae]